MTTIDRTAADCAMADYSRGMKAAFAVVYDGIAPALLGYLERRAPGKADDLFQETLTRMMTAAHTFVPGSRVLPWAFTIARNLVLDGARRDACAPYALAADGGAIDRAIAREDSLDDVIEARAFAASARDALAAMPASQREAWILVREEGLSIAEAAEVLDTTPGAVKLRAHRAYEALRAALEKTRGRG